MTDSHVRTQGQSHTMCSKRRSRSTPSEFRKRMRSARANSHQYSILKSHNPTNHCQLPESLPVVYAKRKREVELMDDILSS